MSQTMRAATEFKYTHYMFVSHIFICHEMLMLPYRHDGVTKSYKNYLNHGPYSHQIETQLIKGDFFVIKIKGLIHHEGMFRKIMFRISDAFTIMHLNKTAVIL